MSSLAAHLVPILRRSPATSTHRRAGRIAGVSHVSLGEVLRGRAHSVSVAKLEAIARAAGATEAELERLRVLAAIERGSLPVARDIDEERVARALAVLEGRS